MKKYKVTLKRLQEAEDSAELKRRQRETLEETEKRVNRKHIVAVELTHREWVYLKSMAKLNHMSAKGYLSAYVKKYVLRDLDIGIGDDR